MTVINQNSATFCILRIPYLFVIFFLLTSCAIKQNATLPQITANKVEREIERLSIDQVDSLKSIYGNNKIFIDEFTEPSLIALSYYPELKNTPIEFKYSDEATTMAARPVPLSLFTKRKYVVLINNHHNFKGIHLENVPFNAQIGVIGHELAHIADYNSYNILGVAGILFRYLDNRRKPLFEKEIDRDTVLRGLGWQLYDWATFSMYTNSTASESYKEFKRNTYMKPEEIIRLMMFLSKYYDPQNCAIEISNAP